MEFVIERDGGWWRWYRTNAELCVLISFQLERGHVCVRARLNKIAAGQSTPQLEQATLSA